MDERSETMHIYLLHINFIVLTDCIMTLVRIVKKSFFFFFLDSTRRPFLVLAWPFLCSRIVPKGDRGTEFKYCVVVTRGHWPYCGASCTHLSEFAGKQGCTGREGHRFYNLAFRILLFDEYFRPDNIREFRY
jgi:hypothetical protein